MKNIFKKSILLFVVAVFLLPILAACNNSSDSTSTIAYGNDNKFYLKYISNYGSEIGIADTTSLYKLIRNLDIVMSFTSEGDTGNALIKLNYSDYQIDSDNNGNVTTYKKSNGNDEIEKLLGDMLWSDFEIAVDKDGNVLSIQVDNTVFMQNMETENIAIVKSNMQRFYNYFFAESELREMVKNIYLPYPNAQIYTDDMWKSKITNYKPFTKAFDVDCVYSGDENGRKIIDLKSTDSGIVAQSSSINYEMTYDFTGKAYIKPSDGFRQVSNYKTTTYGTKREGVSGELATSFRVENAIQMSIT